MKFNIPNINIQRNDNIEVGNNSRKTDHAKSKDLKINKSTLWYQQKKIKEWKSIKVYNKTKIWVE